MTLHAHSLAAYHTTDFSAREWAIVDYLRGQLLPRSDREIAEALGFADLNCVRPRVTALVQRHVLGEALPIRCPISGKRVRTVHLCVRVDA